MGAVNGRAWLGILAMAVASVGCASAVSPTRSAKLVRHVRHDGSGHRLELHTSPHLSSCDDYETLYGHLSTVAQGAIDPNADSVLRVAIDRYGNVEKRLFVELVDKHGRTIDSVDQALRGHMDCPRVLTLAARFASEMIDQARPKTITLAPKWESPTARGPASHEDREAPRPIRPHEATEPQNDRARSNVRPDEPIRDGLRKNGSPKEWIDLPAKPTLESERKPSNRRVNDYASPQNEVYRPLPQTESCPREQDKPSAPTISNQGSPINVTVINGDAEKEKKDETPPPDPMLGANFSVGGGVMHGQWNRWNIAARIGAGYLKESGNFEFDVDLTGAGSKVDVANGANSDIHGAFGLNVGLCGRSSPLGFCLLLSGLADVHRGSAANAEWNGALGFGGGMRSWLQVPLGDTWGLRINLEMVVPIMMQDGIDENARIWDPWTPTGALILTLVHAIKSTSPDKKGDDKTEKK